MRVLTKDEVFLLEGAASPHSVLVGPGYESCCMALLMRGLLAFRPGTDGEEIDCTARGRRAFRIHRAYQQSIGA